MKKSGLIIILLSVFFTVSCNRSKKEKEYVKKVEHSEETIAVGIYKATGYAYTNVKYIAEALKIDAGIVYVTLSDADLLKTKLENIDVLLLPSLSNTNIVDKVDDEIATIITDFINKRGKGAIAMCNGAGVLSCTPGYQSLNLIDIKFNPGKAQKISTGITNFQLTEQGKQIFPELADIESLYINLQKQPVSIDVDTSKNINVLGYTIEENKYPLFITSQNSNGRIAVLNANVETTPGMRWIIPRLVRWIENKDFAWYEKNVVRPEIYTKEIVIDESKQNEIKKLIAQLNQGRKNEVISAMDQLQEIYPWAAAEQVRSLLVEKTDDIKLRAAEYLVSIEYTMAMEDLDKLIQKERSRKVREKLTQYRNELDAMTEQN
ncbi:MAG: hypothetical protein KQH79_11530 [Bacteroidetes bacterium]|nr:hypothetical protein [Bacteroidota bacterium]